MWPVSVDFSLPVAMSQSLTSLSEPLLASVLPSGERARSVTYPSAAAMVRVDLLVEVSQKIILPSAPPEMSVLPSDE